MSYKCFSVYNFSNIITNENVYNFSNIITNENESNFLTPSGFESVYHPVLNDSYESDEEKVSSLQVLDSEEIIRKLKNTTNLQVKMKLLHVILKREGPGYSIGDLSVEDSIEEVYVKACYLRNWSVVRLGAALLRKTVVSLAPSITSMLVCGKQVKYN